MARIPIKKAREVGHQFDFDQVVILARNSVTGIQHVTTWGATKALCDETALLSNEFKREILEWDEESIKAPMGVLRLPQADWNFIASWMLEGIDDDQQHGPDEARTAEELKDIEKRGIRLANLMRPGAQL